MHIYIVHNYYILKYMIVQLCTTPLCTSLLCTTLLCTAWLCTTRLRTALLCMKLYSFVILHSIIVRSIIVYGYHIVHSSAYRNTLFTMYIEIFVQFWRSDISAKRQLPNVGMTDEVNHLFVGDISKYTEAPVVGTPILGTHYWEWK